MSASRPEFHLRRVTADGDAGPVEVYPVRDLPADTQMGRRGFLGAGVALSSVATLIGGCSKETPPDPTPAPETSSTEKSQPVKPSNVSRGRPATVIYAHASSVNALAMTPDGKTLVSGAGVVKLWSLADGKLLQTLKALTESVLTLVLTPDGRVLVSAGMSDIKLWSLPDGTPFQSITPAVFFSRSSNDNSVPTLAVTPDGKTLISSSGADLGAVEFRSLPNEKVDQTLDYCTGVRALAVTPDGKTLATAESNAVKLWSLPDRKLARTISSHASSVKALLVTPDGNTLVTGSADKTIRLWSLPEGTLSRTITLTGSTNRGIALAVTPDGKRLVSADSGDTVLKIWSLSDGSLTQTLTGHSAGVTALAVSPDGKTLASADGGGVIILWDVITGNRLRFLFDPAESKADAVIYNVTDPATGRSVSYTLPFGAPIPPGATCVCNCVPGTYAPPTVVSSGGSFCTCNKICTCIPVCQAHKLLHPDPNVRTLAEELLLVMGEREFAYMRWAADAAAPPVREQIHRVMAAIRNGAAPDPARWPAVDDCLNYLDDADEVVGIMAAQAVALRSPDAVPRDRRIHDLLARAEARPWYLRTPSI